MVLPNTLPPSPSTSTPLNTPDPQPPYLSAPLTEIEQTPKRQTGAHNDTEPAAKGDILMEYCSDWLCSSSTWVVTKKLHKKT
jgi:hypothetical protein